MRQKRDPGENLRRVTLNQGLLFWRVVPEYGNDLVGMEASAFSGCFDDDGLKGLRDSGLLLFHRKVRLVPLGGEIHNGVLPGLLPSLITALIAE
jgi:hypothetical protein